MGEEEQEVDSTKDEVVETPKKRNNPDYEFLRKPDFSMGQIQFDRWRDMMNYATQVGIRVKSGETNLFSLYRGSLYELYRQMFEIFRIRGLKRPLHSTNKNVKGLIPLIEDGFNKADEFKRKSDNIPSEEDEELDVLKTRFLVQACDKLSEIAGYLADAIQESGLGIPTSAIMSRSEAKRKVDSGGLF